MQRSVTENHTDLLTVDQAAEILGITPRTIYRYWRLGMGPKRLKLPQKVRIRRADLEGWLDSFEEAEGPRVGRAVAGAEGLRRAAR